MLVEHHLKYSRIILKIIFILLSILSCDSKPIEYNIEKEDDKLVTEPKYPAETNQDKNIPNENVFRNDTMQKKVTIIVIILCLCVVCAIILSFVNIHDDFVELTNFYRGYMGRRLLIQEKRLVYRGQVERVNMFKPPPFTNSKKESYKLQNGGINFIKLEEDLSPVKSSSLQEDIQSTCFDLLTITSPQEDISTCMPTVRRFIEDEAREWRELDYQIQVGKPPTSFCSFLRQYDWNIFRVDGLTAEEIEERKNLLNQFRQWNIFVTERARREMADQDEQKNKKKTPHSK